MNMPLPPQPTTSPTLNPTPPPSAPTASPTETIVPPASSNKKKYIIGGIILVVVVLAAALFSTYLGAKVAPGKKFKILGPSSLTQGQLATVTWDTTPENVKLYPYQKIEYCTGKLLKKKCVVLAAAAVNNGKALVNVPASLPAGKGYYKFTARDPKKKFFGTLTVNSGTVIVKPVEESGDGGGNGGGSGDGGSPSDGTSEPASTTPPDPYGPYDPYGPTPTPSNPPDPYSPYSPY